MSPSIWTRCGGASNLRALSGHVWRAVEAQHVVSTTKLTDSPAEQALLEELIDRRQPRLAIADEFFGLHDLLSAPFRDPPLRHGSRFATRAQRALWYGARELRAAFAEVAYYRLLFLAGTTARLERLAVDLTAFRVTMRTRRGVDLTADPFCDFAAQISSPTDYAESQALGGEMRAAGAEACRYRSARDRLGGTNVALFTPRAFAVRRPEALQVWHCVATSSRVDFVRMDALERATHGFPRTDFEVAGTLPAPAA